MEKKNELVVKEVNFNGTELMAVKNPENGKIYVGISWICNGVGFNKNEKDRQIKNIQADIVLKQGCVKFDAGVFDPNNKTIAIEIDFLPLWLAKISITPKMKENNPTLVEKLIEYQLKAKDVLAEAFINNDSIEKLLKQIYDGGHKAISATKQVVEIEIKPLKEEIEEMKPLSEFAKQVSEAENCIDMKGMSKLIFNKDIKIGRTRLFEFLKNQGILNKDNEPYQKYIENGWFKLIESTYLKKGILHTRLITVCTGKGQIKIFELVKNKYNK